MISEELNQASSQLEGTYQPSQQSSLPDQQGIAELLEEKFGLMIKETGDQWHQRLHRMEATYREELHRRHEAHLSQLQKLHDTYQERLFNAIQDVHRTINYYNGGAVSYAKVVHGASNELLVYRIAMEHGTAQQQTRLASKNADKRT